MKSTERCFEMKVSKVLQIQGGRIVACGKISKGNLSKGDEIYLDKPDGSVWKICIAGIENNRKLVQEISEENEVGLLLSATGFSKENIKVGDVLYKKSINANDSESDREMQRKPLSCSGTVGNYPADAL